MPYIWNMKIILSVFLIILLGLNCRAQVDSNKVDLHLVGTYLKRGSSNQLIGMSVFAGASAIGGYLLTKKDSQTTGAALIGFGAVVGVGFNISGILNYGKAGKYLYESK